MSIAKSVEQLSITIPAGTNGALSAAMSKGQIPANCVPFFTSYLTTLVSSPAEPDQFACRIIINSDGTIAAHRSQTSSVLNIRIAVVEFNPSLVRVQTGYWSSAVSVSGTAQYNTAIPIAVDLNRSFIIGSWSANGYQWAVTGGAFTSYSIPSSAVARMWKYAGGNVNGYWYVVEDISPVPIWRIQTASSSWYSTTRTQAQPQLGAPVDLAKTFVVASGRENHGIAPSSRHCHTCRLNSSTHLIWERRLGDNSVESDFGAFIIELLDGSRVIRGHLDENTASPATISLGTAVDLARSMAWLSSAQSVGSSTDSSNNGPSVVGVGLASIYLSSATQATLNRNTSLADTIDARWEVVEWATTSYKIVGITKDFAGLPLGSCAVYLLKWDAINDTLTYLNNGVSDAFGAYQFLVPDGTATYCVIARKTGGPGGTVFDTTDFILQPVIV